MILCFNFIFFLTLLQNGLILQLSSPMTERENNGRGKTKFDRSGEKMIVLWVPALAHFLISWTPGTQKFPSLSPSLPLSLYPSPLSGSSPKDPERRCWSSWNRDLKLQAHFGATTPNQTGVRFFYWFVKLYIKIKMKRFYELRPLLIYYCSA